MNYSLQAQESTFDSKIKDLNKKLNIAREVAQTLNSKGWQEILGPTLDKMIIDILGAKVNGEWLSGKVDRARSDERREFYIGAKQALVEFHQRATNHLRQIPILENQIKQIELDRSKGMRIPMEDTRYNVEE